MGACKPNLGLGFGSRVIAGLICWLMSTNGGGLVENVAQAGGHNAGLCPKRPSTVGGASGAMKVSHTLRVLTHPNSKVSCCRAAGLLFCGSGSPICRDLIPGLWG